MKTHSSIKSRYAEHLAHIKLKNKLDVAHPVFLENGQSVDLGSLKFNNQLNHNTLFKLMNGDKERITYSPWYNLLR